MFGSEVSVDRQEARPSPERIDPQTRQMIDNLNHNVLDLMNNFKAMNDSMVHNFMELKKDLALLRQEFASKQKTASSSRNNLDEGYMYKKDYSVVPPAVPTIPTPHIPGGIFPLRPSYSSPVYQTWPYTDYTQQPLQSFYPPGVYQIPSLYPRANVQTFGVPRTPEMLQQGMMASNLFNSRSMSVSSDLVSPKQQPQMQANLPAQNLDLSQSRTTAGSKSSTIDTTVTTTAAPANSVDPSIVKQPLRRPYSISSSISPGTETISGVVGDNDEVETYAASFAKINYAADFIEKMNSRQKLMVDGRIFLENITRKQKTVSVVTGSHQAASTAPKPLSEMFKPAPGSWECGSCYTRNNVGVVNCVACSAPSASFAASPTPVSSAAPAKSLSEMFKPALGSWECRSCYTRNNADVANCVACSAPSASTVSAAGPGGNDQTSVGQLFKPVGDLSKAKSNSFGSSSPFIFGIPKNSTGQDRAPTSTFSKPESPEEVQVVYQLTASSQQKAEALRLKLPENFFSYKQKKDCSGCLGYREPEVPLFEGPKESKATTPSAIKLAPPKLNTFNLSTTVTTFSSLAAKAREPVGFKTDPNFVFAGAGQSVFGSAKPVIKNTPDQKQNEAVAEEEEEEEEYDPYYEPIIPIPDAIEVKTGEEDEEKVFCHRAQLYRYEDETKEWKERGIGEMKVLYHARQGTYRLFLRREQVHKIVCNFLITADLDIQNLTTSDCSWMWAGMNYVDNKHAVEKLAVTFKNLTIANKFKTAVDNAKLYLKKKAEAHDSKD